jgi:uncharacterized protein
VGERLRGFIERVRLLDGGTKGSTTRHNGRTAAAGPVSPGSLRAIYLGVSSERAERVRTAWEAYNHGDLDAFLGILDAECEFHEDPAFPEAGVYRGPEEIRAYVHQFREAMEEHSFEIEEVRDLGSAVVVLLHERARGKASGAEVSIKPAFSHRFRDERVIWVRAYLDRDQALADATENDG